MLLDFGAYRDKRMSLMQMAVALTRDDLRRLTEEMIDHQLRLLEGVEDTDVVFVPDDPEANDTFAENKEDANLPWTLGHVVVHATASSEEAAAHALTLARGLPVEGRSRYEVPWETVKTADFCRHRLQESRRMRLSMLAAWPDEPHLETFYQAAEDAPANNAVARFIGGLAHDDSHLEQIRKIVRQAKEARVGIAKGAAVHPGAMQEKTIRVRTADGEMPVFVAHPESGGPFPVALVLMDGVGFREQIKENARRFAADGYYCVAPDLYYRAGEGLHFDFAAIMSEGPEGPTRKRMIEVARSLNPDKAVADVKAALAAIASDTAAESDGWLVCVGYCMGARLALRMAADLGDRVVAAAGIHPGALVNDQPDSPHHELARVRGELYFAFAEQDQSATPELVDRFREEMARQGVRGDVERLPGTAHGFAMADLPVYQREAAERHFERTLELWRRNLHEHVTP